MLIFTAGKIPFFRYMRSLGNTFWCCMLLYAELMWLMLIGWAVITAIGAYAIVGGVAQ